MKKDRRVVAVHKNGLGDYVLSMKFRSQVNLSGIMDLVQEMFEQSELYSLVKYYNPYLSVKRIDSGEEISECYFDEEPEVKFKPYKPLWSTKKTDNEKEIYKRFFRDIKERIKRQDIPLEDKLTITLIDMGNMITYIEGGVDNDVREFVNTVRESIKPNIVEPVKNCRCKESEEYEIPGFESKQEKSTYDATLSKHHTFPCRSCTKVDEKCIPTNFEGGGCGECPKYEDRLWANILKNKKPEKDRYITKKELAMWLSKGNGQWKHTKYNLIETFYVYVGQDDEGVDYMDIRVRKWEDDDWHEPTYNYCFGGK